jgi:hypothetical protein
MSELYSNSLKKSGDTEDREWGNCGEEVKGEVVAGYESNDLSERGNERTAERAREGVGDAQGVSL